MHNIVTKSKTINITHTIFLCVMNQAEMNDGEKRPGSGFTKQLSV